MGNRPRIIRTDLGNGLTTFTPYGVSVDVSDEARRFANYVTKLMRQRGKQQRRGSK